MRLFLCRADPFLHLYIPDGGQATTHDAIFRAICKKTTASGAGLRHEADTLRLQHLMASKDVGEAGGIGHSSGAVRHDRSRLVQGMYGEAVKISCTIQMQLYWPSPAKVGAAAVYEVVSRRGCIPTRTGRK